MNGETDVDAEAHVNEFESGWQAADGTEIFCRGWQPPGTPAGVLCLVHGIGEHSGRYLHVGDRLRQAGYAVMAMDLRGHGRSKGKRGHVPGYTVLLDDIAALLSRAGQRFPGTPMLLYGQSLGGNLVLNYVLRRQPDLAGVIATSPALRLAFSPPGWQLALARLMRRVLPSFTLPRGTDYSAVSRDPNVILALEADPLVHDMVSARLGLDVIEQGEWAMAHAHQLSLPLLLMHGSGDLMASPAASEEFARRVGDNCTLKIWHGLFHELQNAPEKDQVFDFMIQWLRRVAPSSG